MLKLEFVKQKLVRIFVQVLLKELKPVMCDDELAVKYRKNNVRSHTSTERSLYITTAGTRRQNNVVITF